MLPCGEHVLSDRSDLVAAVESRRLLEGLSQAEVAERCGMSQGHYSKLVKGLEPGSKASTALERWVGGDRPSRRSRRLGARERLEARRLLAAVSDACARLEILLADP